MLLREWLKLQENLIELRHERFFVRGCESKGTSLLQLTSFSKKKNFLMIIQSIVYINLKKTYKSIIYEKNWKEKKILLYYVSSIVSFTTFFLSEILIYNVNKSIIIFAYISNPSSTYVSVLYLTFLRIAIFQMSTLVNILQGEEGFD